MKKASHFLLFAMAILVILSIACSGSSSKDIIRPEEIKSRRIVAYDQETYAKLAEQWQEYYNYYPSEYAYANWMRAADYAGDTNFVELLDKGLEKYEANPVLLYLKAATKAGAHNDLESRARLERSVAIDPDYMDPWFMLVVHYMDARDPERLDMALRKILESGSINDEVLDYNYNMISLLEPNAILITNGDNDTFPGWVLTRILKYRPDVSVVNRSLLNSEWYPLYVIEQGLPRFIEKGQLDSLRDHILTQVGKGKVTPGPGIFADTLINLIVESSERAERPVYIAATVGPSDIIERLRTSGKNLGLVTVVTPNKKAYPELIDKSYNIWLDNFRVAGLQSWRLRHSGEHDAGRMLATNYAKGIARNLAKIKETSPNLLPRLFDWYVENVEPVISDRLRGQIAHEWCKMTDSKKIKDWCKRQGIGE